MPSVTLTDFLQVTQWSPDQLARQIGRTTDDILWWTHHDNELPHQLQEWMARIVTAFQTEHPPRGYAMERPAGCAFNEDPSITVVCNVCGLAPRCGQGIYAKH
ncbi:hypothetical protein [Gluconobacter kondonii]|uniref:hypothetical protein n=1 Tax=Gluconobacter kondonii TaxID=941463 RepID=UPI000C08464E|nr:hypothetical protein [Gluconobacter kondonii]